MAWTTTDLLTSVKNRAMIPDASSGSLSTPALLNFATEELLITLVPMILSVREKFFETYQDSALSTASALVTIPARAIGGTVSAVQYLYNGYIRQLMPIDPATVATTVGSASPTNFYFQNNSLVLYPTPNSTQGTVRVRYYQRPSRLEQTANCAQITSLGLGTITCSSVPSSWGTGTVVDFVPQTASQATPYGLSTALTGVSGNVLSVASVPSQAAVGDWIALAEYTPIPELPFEFQSVLAQATAVKALEATGDSQGLQMAMAKLDQYQRAAILMITPRDQGAQKKVVSSWRRL